MKTSRKYRKRRQYGFSLLELLAVVTILGIIALVIVPRLNVSSTAAKANASAQNKAEINTAVERWYFEKGTFPKNIGEIGKDTDFFPSGIPANPVTDGAYSLDANNRAT